MYRGPKALRPGHGSTNGKFIGWESAADSRNKSWTNSRIPKRSKKTKAGKTQSYYMTILVEYGCISTIYIPRHWFLLSSPPFFLTETETSTSSPAPEAAKPGDNRTVFSTAQRKCMSCLSLKLNGSWTCELALISSHDHKVQAWTQSNNCQNLPAQWQSRNGCALRSHFFVQNVSDTTFDC